MANKKKPQEPVYGVWAGYDPQKAGEKKEVNIPLNKDSGFKDMKLAHTMIRIRNLEASLEFYCSFLGLQEVSRKDLGNEATLVFLSDDAGHYHIELTLNRDGRDYTVGDQFGHLAFHVDDLDAVISKVKENGWWFRQSKSTASSRYIFLKDPDGYDIEILQAFKGTANVATHKYD